jgi:RNA polymerase sigma-70 factor (ECF subfamily)
MRLRRQEAKLDTWIRSVAPRAIAYARSLLRRPDTAEDIVQDVFCRLLAHKEYDLLNDGEKLVFRSVTNACINASTRRKALRSLDETGPDDGSLYDTVPSGREPEPFERLEAQHLVQTVARELQLLPPMQRAAVELKAMGQTLERIAEVLDVTRPNAGVLVHRGRKRLRKKLGSRLPEGLR